MQITKPKASFAGIVSLSLLYLLLPNILFLFGWVQWWYAIPAVIMLITATLHICKHLPLHQHTFTKKDIPSLLCSFFICIVAVESLGYTGRVPQSSDFLARNAIFDTLVNCDWPIHSCSGDYFVYYHAFYLFPSLVAKIAAPYISHYTLLYVWTLFGLLLAAGLLSLKYGAKKGALALLFFLLIGYTSDLAWVILRLDSHLDNTFVHAITTNLNKYPWRLHSSYASIWRGVAIDSPHHALPILLFLLLVSTNSLSKKHIFYVASLIVICSPLSSIFVLLFLIIRYWRYICNKNSISELAKGITWFAIPSLIAVVTYLTNKESTLILTPFAGKSAYYIQSWIICYIISLSLNVIPLIYFCRRKLFSTSYFIVYLTTLIVFPFIMDRGISYMNTVLKGSLVTSFCQAQLYLSIFLHQKGYKLKLLTIIILTASTYSILHTFKQLSCFTVTDEKQAANIVSGWHGHLNHPNHVYYNNFFAKATKHPLLYHQESESASHILSPFKTGKKASEQGDTPIHQ